MSNNFYQTRDRLRLKVKSNIRVYPEGDPSAILYEDHNVITLTAKWLFSRLMANVNPTGDNTPPYQLGHEAQYGIWGLAVGAGDPTWAPQTQPIETPMQTSLIAQFLRKPLSKVAFVDS